MINVLTICCQIPVMSNLAISLRDVTVDVYLTPHVRTYLTPYTYKQLKGECVCFFWAEGRVHLQHTRVAVAFARWNFLLFFSSNTIKNSNGVIRRIYAYGANE